MFYENYLGKTDATFTLNFSTGASMVLAQYYMFVRLGREGYTYVMRQMQQNAKALADNLRATGRFEVIGDDKEQLPLVAFRLKADHDVSYDESDVAWQLSAERGWMVPAYTLPPDAQDVKILRALVKETMSREQVDRLTQDIEDACTDPRPEGAGRPGRARAGQAGLRLLTQRGSLRGETRHPVPVARGERVGRRDPGAADAADVREREVRRRGGRA